MATHRITLTYDEAAGLRAEHRCFVQVGADKVSHAEDVGLADAEAVRAALAALVDGNRAEMEARTTALAVQHAAAVTGLAQKGKKRLALGGTVGAMGRTTTRSAP